MLGWDVLDPPWDVAFDYSSDSGEGNLRLGWTESEYGAGGEIIRPGDRYDLTVTLADGAIHGSVRVPMRPALRVEESRAGGLVNWSPVAGAGAYEASFVGADGTRAGTELGRDTTFVIDRPLLAGDRLIVTAYDENLAAFRLEEQLGRAGIDRGFEVFGAAVSVRLDY